MSNIISQAIYNKARIDKFILSMTTPKCFEDIENNQSMFKQMSPRRAEYGGATKTI